MLVIPSSLREEREEIIRSLSQFALLPGTTGKAVAELLDVLIPHFEKEAILALPMLGSISDLVSGGRITALREVAEAQGALLQEYDRMFEEHSELKRFILRAQTLASQENQQKVVDLLKMLYCHSRMEEEVLYPAALLAGTVAKCLLPSQDQMAGVR